MSRSRNFLLGLATAALLAVFALGLGRLLSVRFAAGGVYPAYSTLNAGPLGARAVLDSFARLGRPETDRNFLPLARFKEREGTTLVLAGAGEGFFGEDTEETFDFFESCMNDGLRVVAALNPRAVPGDALSKDPVANPWKAGRLPRPVPTSRSGGRGGSSEVDEVAAGKRWGFQFELAINPDRAPKEGEEVVPAPGGPAAAPRWFSAWRWAELGPEWEVLAAAGDRPVIIRRAFGKGSLTLLSDTVFLSNEALWRAPEPSFLLWLLGGGRRLVFDETLHGTVSDPGVMHLMRRYRLLGFFAGAAVLLALFVWRAGTSLVPVHESVAEARDRPLAGAEGASGFSSLLRQTIPPKQLLRACFTEWAKSPFVRRRVAAAAVATVRDAVVAAEREKRPDPAATYRAITSFLSASPGGSAAAAPPPGDAEAGPVARRRAGS